MVSKEDVDAVLKEEDQKKRAELLIETAKKVLGPDYSMFVSPEDIVSVSILSMINNYVNLLLIVG